MRPPVTKASSFSGISILTRGDSSKGGSAGRISRPGTAASPFVTPALLAGLLQSILNNSLLMTHLVQYSSEEEKSDFLDLLPILKSSCLFDFLSDSVHF